MSRAAVTMPRGAIARFLTPKPAASTSDGEEEWAPRRRGRRLVDEDEEDEEEEGKTDTARRYVDGDDSDRGSMSDFIVDDEGGSDEEEEDEEDDMEEISEAEEDNAFEERPLNRPARASTASSKSSGAKQPRKKRKRSTTEGEERRNRTRRRELAAIRDDDDLDDPTRLAREAEKLRASGMQFGQDEVIDAEDNAAALDALSAEDQVPLVCLNPRKEDGQPPDGPLGSETQPVFVHPAVSGKLKKHQVKGAQFLWSHVAPEPSGFGCILADFMGLGKTLQVITVVQAFLALKRRRSSDGSLANRHKHVLILAPTICVRNWEAEIVKWIGKKDARKLGVHTLESSREKKMVDRVTIVKQWHRRGGILIMGYELYRILVLQSSGEEKIAAGNAKHTHLIREVYKCISDPGPDLIVLDEGHRVRDHKSKLVKALSHVKTARRIILTGYPLQNHLEEYWTMVNFARPDYLGSLEDFKNRFVNPIENGQCVDSTESDRKLARQRAFILTHELKTLVLRRDQEFLFRQLPPKKEWVMLCKLTEPQATLYRKFLEFGVPKRVGGKIDVLGGYHISLAISNHPDVLEETYRYLEEAVRKGTLVPGMRKRTGRSNNDDGGEDEDLLQYLTVDLGQPSSGSAAAAASRRESTGLSDEDSDSILEALDAPSAGRGGTNRAPPTGVEHRLSFAQEFMQQYLSGMLESSGKMQLLMEILRECKAIGDRVILFSQSIPTLNTVEKMIAQSNRREKRHSNRMTYLRIDGSTPQQERFRMIGQFNDLEEDADLIMISTKAGGEGVNLCAGNRIIIFDVCWNPCNDSQSMCRSYRFGQVKPVFVYRFVSAGTMEKKVYDLQIRKEGVAKRIVDEKALERKFKTADLQNYFNLDDFEQAMQQQSTVLSRPAPAAAANISSSPAVVNIEDVSSDTSSAATDSTVEAALSATSISTTAPGGDAVLEKVLNKIQDERLDWVIDWFEQETMFEETIDDNCTEAEQEEITSSYRYMKAVRGMRLDGSKDGVLVMLCGTCRIPNNIYPETMTRVPVPKYIECQYCKRPTATTGAIPHAQAQANPAALTAVASAGGTPLVGYPGARGAYLPYGMQAGVAGRIDTGAAASGAPAGAQFAVENMAPHIRALHIQQQLQQQQRDLLQQQQAALSSSEALRRQLEQDRREREMKLKERETWKLCDRTLLVLRRGINKVQELKRMAESCGARLAIEVSPQLTDIVSGLSVKETLEWLKLNKLPRDVSFHNEAWLRDEIAKEKGLPRLTTDESKPAAPTGSSAGNGTGSTAGGSRQQAIAIDLSDSDGDADMDGGNSVTTAAATRATPAPPAAQQQEEVDDDDDFVEIID